jgi:hypothetical protein
MEKNLVGLLELETAVLECFLEKTPLSPLGVKVQRITHCENELRGYLRLRGWARAQ